MNFLYRALFFLESTIIDKTGNAPAATAAAIDPNYQTTSGGLMDLIPTIAMSVGMIAVVYFLMIRPQRKREKEMANMQEALKVGDRVLTSAGFYGKIVDVGTDAFMIEFGENRGIRVPVRKSDVVAVKTPVMAPQKDSEPTTSDKKDEK